CARPPLAVLVAEVCDRRHARRAALDGPSLPRLPRMADHRPAALGRRRRPRAEPRARQEPRRLRTESGPVKRKHALPSVDGVLSADDVRATVDAIAAIQLPDGNIPWTPGAHTDPWNLIEAAMALDVGGRHTEAVRAYEWLRARQHAAGCWHAY